MSYDISGLKLIRRGKVKDIYELDEDRLFFVFSDRISAFDVILPSTVPNKGKILCKFAQYWFETLNIRNHMVKVLNGDRMIVEKLSMIPLECVVRGYMYGSLYERWRRGEVKLSYQPTLAEKLAEPIFDPTTKSEEKDLPVTTAQIVEEKILSEAELKFVREKSIELYNQMNSIALKSGFIIADVKFEFGKNSNGEIVLADSLGPDEFRLWLEENYSPGRIQEAFDKQVVRDWLIRVGYKSRLDKALKKGETPPEPPSLPEELVSLVVQRYIYAYEKISGRRFS